MSKQTDTTNFPTHVERYICPNDACDGAEIRPEFIFRNVDVDNARRNTATVKAFCPHCETAYQCRQVLEGGIWHTVGEVSVITDPKRKAGVKARVDERRGVQVAQAG